MKFDFKAFINLLQLTNEPIRNSWERFYNVLDRVIEYKNQEIYFCTASPKVNAFIETLPDYDWNIKTFTFKGKKFIVQVDVYNTKTELIFENIAIIE